MNSQESPVGGGQDVVFTLVLAMDANMRRAQQCAKAPGKVVVVVIHQVQSGAGRKSTLGQQPQNGKMDVRKIEHMSYPLVGVFITRCDRVINTLGKSSAWIWRNFGFIIEKTHHTIWGFTKSSFCVMESVMKIVIFLWFEHQFFGHGKVLKSADCHDLDLGEIGVTRRFYTVSFSGIQKAHRLDFRPLIALY